MKTFKQSIAVTLVLLAASPIALGGGFAMPGTGIYGTEHDFTGNVSHAPLDGVTELGLCSICHTPHSAYTTKLLWNQTLTTATFTWGAVTTTGGTTLPNSAHLGPSTKCLSCHDGTVGVGDVAMFHGKRQVFPTGESSILRMGKSGNGVGYKGDMSAVHPIGVPYPLNNATGTYNGMTTGNEVILAEFISNPHSPNTGAVKLYNDDGSGNITPGAVAGASGIECTTCHDPHNKQVQDEFFVRGKLAGSSAASGYICMQCHIK